MPYILDPFQRIIGLGGFFTVIFERAGTSAVCPPPSYGITPVIETVRRRYNLNPPFDFTDTVIDTVSLGQCPIATGNWAIRLFGGFAGSPGDLYSSFPDGASTHLPIRRFNVGEAKRQPSGRPGTIQTTEWMNIGVYPLGSGINFTNQIVQLDLSINGVYYLTKTYSNYSLQGGLDMPVAYLGYNPSGPVVYPPPGQLDLYRVADFDLEDKIATIGISKNQNFTFTIRMTSTGGFDQTRSVEHVWI